MQDQTIELYNEFSVYYRVGSHLENLFNMDYKIQFMREPEFFGIDEPLIKSTLDITIFDDDLSICHAVEVVYIKDEPQLEKMFEICTGLRFMEQMVELGWDECYVLLIADLPPERTSGIEQPHFLFRGETTVEGSMQHPNGNMVIDLRGAYTIKWIQVDDTLHYAVLTIRQ